MKILIAVASDKPRPVKRYALWTINQIKLRLWQIINLEDLISEIIQKVDLWVSAHNSREEVLLPGAKNDLWRSLLKSLKLDKLFFSRPRGTSRGTAEKTAQARRRSRQKEKLDLANCVVSNDVRGSEDPRISNYTEPLSRYGFLSVLGTGALILNGM